CRNTGAPSDTTICPSLTLACSLTVFFFQAEDGIRDRNVTGVQTCALPISPAAGAVRTAHRRRRPPGGARAGRRCVKLLDVTEFYSPLGGGVRTYLAAKARWLASRHDVQHVIVVPSNKTAVAQWERSRVHLVRGPAVPASPGYHFWVAGRKLGDIVTR